MSTERDPRIDPRPGDMVEIEVGHLRHRLGVEKVMLSIEVSGQLVYFAPSDGRMKWGLSLMDWREYTRDARIVASAKEEPA